MAAQVIVLFASALFVQTISAQCIGSLNTITADELAFGNALAYGPNRGGMGFGGPSLYQGGLANYGCAANSFIPSSGGGFAVTSTSPISPTGITVYSENAIEGILAMNGELPFLGAVAVEGALPSTGAGGISYGCGNGAVGIVSDNIGPAVGPAYGGPVAGVAPGRFGFGQAGPGVAGLGYNGFAGNCAYGPGGVY